MRVPHGQGPTPATNVGIIWNLMKTSNGDIVFHGRRHRRFRTEMAFDPAHQRGVVVLTNAAVEPSAEDLAIHLLVGSPVRPAGTVPPAPREHKEITLSPADLDRLVGSYRMTPQLTIVITRDGGQLMAQAHRPGPPIRSSQRARATSSGRSSTRSSASPSTPAAR